MMSDRELIDSLRRLKVETGSIACLGCGYEHNCSVHGCRIMRVAAERLEQLTSAVGRQEVMVYRDGGQGEPSPRLAHPAGRERGL